MHISRIIAYIQYGQQILNAELKEMVSVIKEEKENWINLYDDELDETIAL